MLAGSLLVGSAGQWYLSLVDPTTIRLPLSYTIDSFIQELEDFFGGGNTLQFGSAPWMFCVRRGVSQNSPLPSRTLLLISFPAGLITL